MKQITKSFVYARKGIQRMLKTERNFRVGVGIALVMLAVAYILDWAPWKWVSMITMITLILSLEAVNSAVEYTWNHLEPAHHPVVGLIKDIMAGAVVIAVIGAGIVGGILFFS